MDIIKNFTREDLAELINNEFGLTKKDCLLFVNDILDIIIDGLITDGKVKIHNFGTFSIRRKKSRIGRNPKTKVDIMIKERNVISFKASKSIINYLNEEKIV